MAKELAARAVILKVELSRENEMIRSIESAHAQSENIATRLARHPGVQARVSRILDMVENAGGDLKRADDAERCAIEDLRNLGQEILTAWGRQRAEVAAQEIEATGTAVKQVKKTLLAQHVR